MLILTSSGHQIQIDDGDHHLIGKSTWCVSVKGYAVARIAGKTVRMHRLLLNAAEGTIIDHIDGNKLNNCRSNLRFCTQSQNLMNRKPKAGTLKGVRKRGNFYIAQIQADGVAYYLGTFATADEAYAAYKAKAAKLHGEFARFE